VKIWKRQYGMEALRVNKLLFSYERLKLCNLIIEILTDTFTNIGYYHKELLFPKFLSVCFPLARHYLPQFSYFNTFFWIASEPLEKKTFHERIRRVSCMETIKTDIKNNWLFFAFLFIFGLPFPLPIFFTFNST